MDRETLRRSYNRSAPTYDDRFRALQYEKYAVMLREELGHGPWLDLGCGTGLLKEYLAAHARATAPLVGVDFARPMLARARTRSLPVAECPIDALPFRDATFDAVLAFTVLRIVADADAERRTLAEVARVLAPGGTFVLTVLRVRHDDALPERLRSAGFLPEPARACGQDVGYRCRRT